MCRFKFSSKELEQSCGFSYFGFRFYSSQWQRWLNRDPIGEGGGFNLYRYAANDPSALIDTDGRLVVHVWPPQGDGSKGGWYGHASVTLDDGTYISYWPNRPISPPFDSTQARPPNYDQDKGGENGRTPTDYYIQGLDENKIKKWWKNCPHGNFSTLNNCSTITCQALRQGGQQLPGHIIYDPGQVANDLDNLWPHFPYPTSGINNANSIPVVRIR